MKKIVSLLIASALTTAGQEASAEEYFTEVAGNPLGSQADWTNYLVLADLDGNGAIDLIVPNCGGFFSAPSPLPLRIFENDGTSDAALGGGVTDTIRVVAVGDADGDGDLDIYAPNAGGNPDRLFINNGDAVFTDEASTRLPTLSSHSAAAKFGDVDNDGDLDLLVGGGYDASDSPPAFMYLNDGTGVFSDATDQVPQSMSGEDPDDIDWIDVDRDFDLDVVLNAHSGQSALWVNDGSGVFTDATANLAAMMNGYHYNASACDVDDDGDLDLWTDNIGGNYLEQLQINDGSGTFTDATSTQVSGNAAGADDNGVVCVDVDSDGDLDIAIPTLATPRERVLFNDGTGNFSSDGEDDAFSNTSGDPTLWIDFADLDGDGRLDAVTGQGEGSPRRNRLFLGSAAQPVDNQAPKIIKTEALMPTIGAGASPLLRFAVSDRVVTDVGPRLKRAFVRVTVGDSTSETEAQFMGGDLFRAQLPVQDEQGVMVTVEACATDRQDNTGCGNMQSYTIMGTTSSNGAGGAGNGGSSGSSGDGGSSTNGSGGSSGEDPFLVDEGGCSCTVISTSNRRSAPWWLALASLVLLRRRRR